jgi:serine/threonine protein kinase
MHVAMCLISVDLHCSKLQLHAFIMFQQLHPLRVHTWLQVLSSAVEPASDVWAAGVMAYQLLSGRFPFDDWQHPDAPALSLVIAFSPPFTAQLCCASCLHAGAGNCSVIHADHS